MILLVDDEALLRDVTRDYLTLKRFAVTAVENVTAAYAAIDELGDRFALVITDHRLPDGTGWDVAAYARRMQPALPVILVSGYSELPTQDGDAVDMTRVTFLPKPFEMSDLVDEINRALEADRE
jgi:DNA-binding NtrC family response regulator